MDHATRRGLCFVVNVKVIVSVDRSEQVLKLSDFVLTEHSNRLLLFIKLNLREAPGAKTCYELCKNT